MDEDPGGDKEKDFTELINTDSVNIVANPEAEPALLEDKDVMHYQFLRKGYYCLDPDSTDVKAVYNRTTTLRDGWAKMQKNR
jgi:glutaminyl-tRNA synthetase